ncbi:hypothetical protein KHS38_12365 [Mucilaginibacter sp. Bleaf8]|uniref:hypothetical protein n=1 Tax=Mucilaginibacter sp. Bleaf8 TaxID=2834430 RepID=UPI001BD0C991|nr:hypothetical protein [Mucilaginibacter sp. Bleaf8]MBS7565198.1 hypothetical protein [Mucilaginibacter sp. Bleaf8]
MKRKTLLPLLCFTLVLSLVAYSCKKDNCEEKHKYDNAETTATIIDTGSPALDGCGWLIKIGDTTYAPDNLPENFQLDNIQVKITYKESDATFRCGAGAIKYIHLYDIRR